MHVQPTFKALGNSCENLPYPWIDGTDPAHGGPATYRAQYSTGGSSPAATDCWATSIRKRIFDVTVASVGLVVLSPVIAITAVAVKASSNGPVLFRQTRMGSHGRTFTILKFRTMRTDRAVVGPSVTKAGDKRLTRIGSFLRKCKLDEFPQLVNVVRGDMSLVGPRPKVPHHQTTPLNFRPGITGAASIAFRDEEQVLHRIPEKHLDDYQVHVLMPVKTELDESYMRRATLSSDIRMLFRTIFGHRPAGSPDGAHRAQHSLVVLNAALQRAADRRANFAVDRAAS